MKRKTSPVRAVSKGALIAPGAATLFFIFLCVAVSFGRLPFVALVLYVVASVAAFVAYAVDKRAARNHQHRIPESCLHLCSLIGGWPGALVAQQLARHKTRKLPFQILFWITVALNAGVLGWLFSRSGVDAPCFSSSHCASGKSGAIDQRIRYSATVSV